MECGGRGTHRSTLARESARVIGFTFMQITALLPNKGLSSICGNKLSTEATMGNRNIPTKLAIININGGRSTCCHNSNESPNPGTLGRQA